MNFVGTHPWVIFEIAFCLAISMFILSTILMMETFKEVYLYEFIITMGLIMLRIDLICIKYGK
jgi:hypothetical protein